MGMRTLLSSKSVVDSLWTIMKLGLYQIIMLSTLNKVVITIIIIIIIIIPNDFSQQKCYMYVIYVSPCPAYWLLIQPTYRSQNTQETINPLCRFSLTVHASLVGLRVGISFHFRSLQKLQVCSLCGDSGEATEALGAAAPDKIVVYAKIDHYIRHN